MTSRTEASLSNAHNRDNRASVCSCAITPPASDRNLASTSSSESGVRGVPFRVFDLYHVRLAARGSFDARRLRAGETRGHVRVLGYFDPRYQFVHGGVGDAFIAELTSRRDLAIEERYCDEIGDGVVGGLTVMHVPLLGVRSARDRLPVGAYGNLVRQPASEALTQPKRRPRRCLRVELRRKRFDAAEVRVEPVRRPAQRRQRRPRTEHPGEPAIGVERLSRTRHSLLCEPCGKHSGLRGVGG